MTSKKQPRDDSVPSFVNFIDLTRDGRTATWDSFNTSGTDPGLLGIQVDAEFTFRGWPHACIRCGKIAFIYYHRNRRYYCPVHCPRLVHQDYLIQ